MTLLLGPQAQKRVPYDKVLRILDGLVQLSVLDRDLTMPTGSPTDGAWLRPPPQIGRRVWVEDETALLVFGGSGWVSSASIFRPNEFAAGRYWDIKLDCTDVCCAPRA